MKTKLVNKIGLWMIAGVYLLALLVINVLDKRELVTGVVVSAIVVLTVWIAIMAVWSRYSR